MTRWIALAGWVGTLTACGTVNPCDEYVDYMCGCHADDIDCEDLTLTYDGAEPAVQDECAVLLDEAEQADQDAGKGC